MLIVAIAHDSEEVKEQVDDIEVEVEGDVDRVIERFGNARGAIPVVTDVEAEDASPEPIEQPHPRHRRNEHLHHPDSQQAEQRRKQHAAQLAEKTGVDHCQAHHDDSHAAGRLECVLDELRTVDVHDWRENHAKRNADHVETEE